MREQTIVDDFFQDSKWSAESQLIRLAVGLGARRVASWSGEEKRLAQSLAKAPAAVVSAARQLIQAGHDPLGDRFCRIRTSSERRKQGATFTPASIVRAMVQWTAGQEPPALVVDPGVGSGRFLLQAGRVLESSRLLGVEIDPLLAIVARGNLAAANLASRARVGLADYRSYDLPRRRGRTLFLGNPPYVRHHLLGASWKKWLTETASKRDLPVSQLSGMHIHFLLATACKARPGDYGTFITAAEWLDVNYGALARKLFLDEIGGQQLTVIEPSASPFPDAAATGAILFFRVGEQPSQVRLRRVERLDELQRPRGGRLIPRRRLLQEQRWSRLFGSSPGQRRGYVELGEICRVHRGQVTGNNRFWIAGAHSQGLPSELLFPAVTRAKELFRAGEALRDLAPLRQVIDLPPDLDLLDGRARELVERFLQLGTELGVPLGYVASRRRAWWSVGLREPPPILATYMARRPPAFVLNSANARFINIAHGLYPRQELSRQVLADLASYLSQHTSLTAGRTYAGGLTKFEPGEMERLLVPRPELLSGKRTKFLLGI